MKKRNHLLSLLIQKFGKLLINYWKNGGCAIYECFIQIQIKNWS
jgi:hypothetical protein